MSVSSHLCSVFCQTAAVASVSNVGSRSLDGEAGTRRLGAFAVTCHCTLYVVICARGPGAHSKGFHSVSLSK